MSQPERHSFQAEIQQVLDIVIHSLYTDREIFIRELVSNAADASEKLRFLQTSGTQVCEPDSPLKIEIAVDESAGTLSITDHGIGMNRDELVQNLGTIAHSGSKAFLQQLAQNPKPDASLIGQFGVGFYSAFMVAREVRVSTRSFRPDDDGWTWRSEGAGSYEIEPRPGLPRGTRVDITLKDDAREFALKTRVESIIKRYSNFVPFPIDVDGTTLNTVRAIWARNKAEIKEAEYNEFYHFIGHDPTDPLLRLHFTADAPIAIQSLLFVPARNFEVLGLGRTEPEVNLYCRKVLIQARAKGLFPEWLRFLRGVVDSEDLPLNISRETMQDSSLIQKLNRVLSGRFLKQLEETAEKDPPTFDKFYDQYQRFLKEGVVTDDSHRESLGRLLRFESPVTEPGKATSIADYVARMPSDQKEIYFVLAPNRAAAEASPYYEVFRSRNFEVLFALDPWDEFVMEHLHEFNGKRIVPAEKADLKIDPPTDAAGQLSDADATTLASWMKSALGDTVESVRPSSRLVDSPVVVLDTDRMSPGMRRMLKATQREASPARYDLEINPRHPLILALNRTRETDPALGTKVALQLLDNARAAAGVLDDPRSMVQRMNELLAHVLNRPA